LLHRARCQVTQLFYQPLHLYKFVKLHNNIKQINKDPTDKYQRRIQQTIQRCNLLVDKQMYKYLTNIKPMAP